MRIVIRYSHDNPAHLRTRDFLREYLRDRGVLADIKEINGGNGTMAVSVDGFPTTVTITEPDNQLRDNHPTMRNLTQLIDCQSWCA